MSLACWPQLHFKQTRKVYSKTAVRSVGYEKLKFNCPSTRCDKRYMHQVLKTVGENNMPRSLSLFPAIFSYAHHHLSLCPWAIEITSKEGSLALIYLDCSNPLWSSQRNDEPVHFIKCPLDCCHLARLFLQIKDTFHLCIDAVAYWGKIVQNIFKLLTKCELNYIGLMLVWSCFQVQTCLNNDSLFNSQN